MASNSRAIQNGFRIGMRLVQQSRFIKQNASAANVFQNLERKSSTSSYNLQQQALPKLINTEVSELCEVKKEGQKFSVTFEDNSKGVLPFLWLRENCQCSSCFDKVALGRNFLMQNLDLNIQPTEVHLDGSVLKVTWNDNHTSSFDSKWLYQRAFNSQARNSYRNLYRLQREAWGKDLFLDNFNYEDLKTNDSSLLKWLLTMETKGVALVKNAPDDPDAGAQLIDHIGFVKQSHYGRRSPVIVRENSNNVAFSNIKLGLHTDLSQYYHQPGMIFIQTVKQHEGKGGESSISDGLCAAELLRKDHPKAFEMLTKNNVYFWDKGVANLDMETDEFYKICKAPIIGLDNEGNLEILRVNNQVRDSHLDLHPEEVNSFYEAAKLLDDTLYDNSYNFKMEDGDILTMDNVRCLHGREGYESSSARHLESSYLDWDEALCRRRRLLEKLGYV